MDVVIAGSSSDPRFVVVDFTDPANPTSVVVTPHFSTCQVDASGTLVAVGDSAGSTVAIYDISDPSNPIAKGTIGTQLSGIGAISIDGAHVLAGELNGSSTVLIDATDPSNLNILSKVNTQVGPILSVALSGNKAAAAGPNDPHVALIDFANPANPSVTLLASGTDQVLFGDASCDLDGTALAIGDLQTGNVFFLDVSGAAPAFKGKAATAQDSVNDISISGSTVAASSADDFTLSLVSFAAPAAPTQTNSPGLNSSVVVKLAGDRLAVGNLQDSDVALFSVAGTTVTKMGQLTTGLFPISNVAFTTVTTGASEPQIAVTPTSVAFGPQLVGTTPSQALTIKNLGGAALSVSKLKSSTADFTLNPDQDFSIAAGGAPQVIEVTFAPTTVASYGATLTMATNDPNHQAVSIPLSGVGAYPHLSVAGTLNFGNVAVCLSHLLPVQVGNTGAVALHLTQIQLSGAGFSEGIGTSLVVSANSTGQIPVTFEPPATGAAAGQLTFNTDDPTNPSVTIALSATGTPEPPPTVSVSPTAIDFHDVPVAYFAGVGVTVANTGPCEVLEGVATVTGKDFTLMMGSATVMPTVNSPIPFNVVSGASQSFTVVFGPTSQAAENGALTITSNDPAQANVVVPLQGTGVAVAPAAIELILDRSGSMATAIQGGGTRMTALQSAVDMFADLVISGTGFAMGAVDFDSLIEDLTPLAALDDAQRSSLETSVAALTPRFLTSIGGGLQEGQAQLAASPLPRKVAVVFTDGYENTPPMIAIVEPSVVSAGTEVYSVGLGDPVYLSTQALAALAASTGGKFFQTTDPLVLRKQFVEILADAFRQPMATDPIITLQEGVQQVVPVQITECEGRISFVLMWEDSSAQIQLSIRAPDGTTFNPSAATTNQLVRYAQRPGYRFFQIALPPGPSGTIGPQQVGEWQMLIDSVSVPGGATRAATNVMVESELQLQASIVAPSTNAPIQLSVQLTAHGTVLPEAVVRATLTAPVSSLAAASTPQAHHRALAADTHPIPAHLLTPTKTHTSEHILSFNRKIDRRGAHVLELPPPKIDGVYHFAIEATGQTCGGIFQRYWSASFYVGAQRGRGR